VDEAAIEDLSAATTEPELEEAAAAAEAQLEAMVLTAPEPAAEAAEPDLEPTPDIELAPAPVIEPAPEHEPAAEPPLAAAEATPAGEERATNTLGELYLAQGHLADAERVFRAVLARRSDDPAARAGLAEVQRRRAAPLTAGELLDWARDRGDRPPEGGERRERSAVLLRTYLARLRRRSPADVP
jgi:hypothetical protein